MFNKMKAVIIGHAIGDALGVPVEFATREELDNAPVETMEGFGTYPMPKGSWSDDTSMALATLEALINKGVDYDAIMGNFAKWYFEDGFTPTGEMFDVGNTCSIAIEKYVKDKKSWSECGLNNEHSNGNGSLMRIHPIVLYLSKKDIALEEKIEIIHNVSALTHAHDRSKIACGIYAFILWELLENPTKESIFKALQQAKEYYKNNNELSHYYRLFEKTFIVSKRSSIKSSGYVVDTLEAVIWCVLTSTSYKECVLKAVNLGDDTDTVAAISGGLAGVLYGYETIPNEWKESLLKFNEIEKMCEKI